MASSANAATIVQSTFELSAPDINVALPAQGWTSLSGSGPSIFDFTPLNTANGALMNFGYANYTVQYLTGTPIESNSAYQLVVDMGYIANIANGNSSYLVELGTISSGVFTALASQSGSVAYLGNLTRGVVSGSTTVNFSTGNVVSGNPLAVRLAQTASLGPGRSDNFAFADVLLTADKNTPVVVPEPREQIVLLLGTMVLAGLRLRRKATVSE